MKMDFPSLFETSAGERSRIRYDAIIACAVNRQLARISGFAGEHMAPARPVACDALQSRIDYFGRLGGHDVDLPVGAFLPEKASADLVNAKTESGIYLDASANGKPTELGSRLPGHPETMRGMEN